MNLIMFESWPDRQLKVCFNPLVEVVATQEIPNAKRTPINCHIYKQPSSKINSQR